MNVAGIPPRYKHSLRWFNESHTQHASVRAAALARPPESPLYVSAVTLGEILYGHAGDPGGEKPRRAQYRTFISTRFPQTLPVSEHTAIPYGEIRAAVANKWPPKGGWNKKKRAEELYDPIAARELGIDENDLWPVAQAVERNLVLVTTDKMTRIQEAVVTIHKSFRVENWTKTDQHPQDLDEGRDSGLSADYH